MVWHLWLNAKACERLLGQRFNPAAAIYAECDYFITTDDRVLRYRTDRIKVVNPVQFITEEK